MDKPLPQRLKEALVNPSIQPLVDEARLTLEAIYVEASGDGEGTDATESCERIIKLVNEGVRESGLVG